jgi:hypothetical protein
LHYFGGRVTPLASCSAWSSACADKFQPPEIPLASSRSQDVSVELCAFPNAQPQAASHWQQPTSPRRYGNREARTPTIDYQTDVAAQARFICDERAPLM